MRPADNVPEQFWNIGIRIEDDVLITKTGNEVLSKNAVKSVADIESLMQNGKLKHLPIVIVGGGPWVAF